MNVNRLIMLIILGLLFTLSGCTKPMINEDDFLIENSLNDSEIERTVREKYSLNDVNYPQGISYDDYKGQKTVRENNLVSEQYLEAVNNFTIESSSLLLNQNKNLNNLYSPISLYMALALLASGAKDQTQLEILSILGMDNTGIVQLEEQTGNLFRLLYTDNEIGELLLANSLWLDSDISFNKNYLDTASEDYYSSLFSVDFSKEETGNLISQWVTENSKGTLERSYSVNSDQIMSIINTIYFYDEWTNEFDVEETKEDTFYLTDKSTLKCDFMNKNMLGQFIEGENFISTSLNLKNQGAMNFYLPTNAVSVYDLISTPEELSSILDRDNPANVKKYGEVIFKAPKFDFGVALDLNESLKILGMNDAFEQDADFTGLVELDGAYVSNITQSSHISIDEIGCEASSYTEILFVGSPIPIDKAKIILDKPFIFTITSNTGVILFIGIVNNPLNN